MVRTGTCKSVKTSNTVSKLIIEANFTTVLYSVKNVFAFRRLLLDFSDLFGSGQGRIFQFFEMETV